MSTPRAVPFLLALIAAALLVAGCSVGSGDDDGGGEPEWAKAADAKIHPGVQTKSPGQCTANFVFYDDDNVYIGQSAHCAGKGESSDTNGCKTTSKPVGTKITIQGATRPGTLAYSSWLAMNKAGEKDTETCAYNDFALVKIDKADEKLVNPSLPKFGGPQGMGVARVNSQVFTYGNSSLRLGIALFSPKNGAVVENSPGGWSHTVYTLTPGIPGDSGSAVLNNKGQALGTLSTVQFTGKPLSNGIGDLTKELAYAKAHGFPDLKLADGTEKFRESLFGLT
jgi:hypothetical protein